MVGKAVPVVFPLLGVRLLCRVRIGKRRDGHAGLINAHHPRIGIKRAVEGFGGRYLGDEANVRDRRPLAMTEPAARGVFGKQCLHRLEAGAKPMLNPGKPLVVADLQHVGKIMSNTGHDERVRVGDIGSTTVEARTAPIAPAGVGILNPPAAAGNRPEASDDQVSGDCGPDVEAEHRDNGDAEGDQIADTGTAQPAFKASTVSGLFTEERDMLSAIPVERSEIVLDVGDCRVGILDRSVTA